MPTVQMTVQYINEPKPGRKRGSIKSTDGTLLGCWGDKLSLFEVGKTYDIEYSEASDNGTVYRNVQKAKEVARAAAAKPTADAVTPRYETSPRDSERMFVTSILNAFIQSGQLRLDEQELSHATQTLRAVYHDTYSETATEDRRTGTR